MFRLPTHLETLLPPPREQLPQSQPWRGLFSLAPTSPHPAARPRELRVTAAETVDDNQQERWPRHFQLQVIARKGILREVQARLSQPSAAMVQSSTTLPSIAELPRCMLMPDRLPDQAASRENQAQFEALARHLLEEEIVAIAPWSTTDPAGAVGGILLYPTSTTRTLLVGIVFLASAFPDFLEWPGGSSPSRAMHALSLLPRHQPFQPVTHHTPFDPAPPNISSASRYSAGGFESSRGRSGRSSG